MSARRLRLAGSSGLFLLGFALFAVSLPALAQEDAKAVWQKAQDAITVGDQCAYLQFACKAADLDPKKKDYRRGCNDAHTSLVDIDRDNLKKARGLLDDKKFDAATRASRSVCKADDKVSGDLQALLRDIQKAQSPQKPVDPGPGPTPAPGTPPTQPAQTAKNDPSAAAMEKAQQNYNANDFAQAVSAANQVTDASRKPEATELIARVNSYTAALQEGSTAEQKRDYAGAIRAYQNAARIKANGPGDPLTRINNLQPLLAAQPGSKNKPPTPNVAASPAPPKPADDENTKVARLVAQAHQQEQAGDLQGALKTYAAVQHMQPGNSDAATGQVRVQVAINRDPAEQAKVLTQAIRDFYGAKYTDCEDELATYLASPTAKSKGAAFFYLGAVRLYRGILDNGEAPAAAITSEQVQRSLKSAKTAGYTPLPQFVSPLVMRAWQNVQ